MAFSVNIAEQLSSRMMCYYDRDARCKVCLLHPAIHGEKKGSLCSVA